jgi:hypothetical protein
MKKLVFCILFILFSAVTIPAIAQCPMCKASVESSLEDPNNMAGRGLNNGIMYLLVMPYLLIATIGVLWYFRFKKKRALNEVSYEGHSLN